MTASAGTERPQPRAIIALTRAIRWRTGWPDLAAFLLLGLVLYGVAKVGAEWHAPLRAQVDISLKLRTLPLYAFFSLCRGMSPSPSRFFSRSSMDTWQPGSATPIA